MRKYTARPLALAAAVAAVAGAAVAPSAAAQDLPPEALVLGDGRFAVTATFQAPGAPLSPAFPAPLTRDTGYFWFFDPDNVELVVKVLQACPVNGRIWVFAAGLTNVTVELTVEDRLADETWTRAHTGGPPFPPIQDTAAFATCELPALCGQGTAAEIAATPRADQDAELIALELGGELTAPQALYERVSADLAAIRATAPDLVDVPFIPQHHWGRLLLLFDDATAAAVDAGTYDAWDCANSWYGAVSAEVFSGRTALVEFAGRFDVERIAAEYALLPGVESAETDDAARALPHTEFLCAIAEGDTIHYFADTGFEVDRLVRHFTSAPGTAPQADGEWRPNLPVTEPLPPWFQLHEQCVELYVAECCALS